MKGCAKYCTVDHFTACTVDSYISNPCEKHYIVSMIRLYIAKSMKLLQIIGASRSEPHSTEFYAFRGISEIAVAIRDCGSNLYVGMRVVEMF